MRLYLHVAMMIATHDSELSGAVTPLFYGLCAFALVHEGLQLRALRILGREDDDRRRAAAVVGRAGIQIA